MKEWFIFFTEYTVLIIDALVLVIVVIGTIETVICGLRLMISSPASHELREVWLRYARWLVAGLTFQLAADIVETSITTGWDAVGRIIAIAVVRTFLNYFLERDLTDIRARQRVAVQ